MVFPQTYVFLLMTLSFIDRLDQDILQADLNQLIRLGRWFVMQRSVLCCGALD